jgi:hypothetical protein
MQTEDCQLQSRFAAAQRAGSSLRFELLTEDCRLLTEDCRLKTVYLPLFHVNFRKCE